MLQRKVITCIVMLFILVIVGCGSSTVTQTPPVNTPAVKETPPPVITPIVKITDITEKSEADVAKVLGQHVSIEPDNNRWKYYGTNTWIENCPTINYKNGVTVKFVEGKAARITVTPTSPLEFSDLNKAMQLLGLTPANPTSTGGDMALWKNVQGIYQLQIFNKDGKIDYMYAVVNEKYR